MRDKLAIPADAHVTVRIEDEESSAAVTSEQSCIPDPAFGIWRDRDDMADVGTYLQKLRASRYRRDGI